MIKRSRAIPRRTLLRGILGGALASLALPPLEAMFESSGRAYADGTPIRKRFGMWFWGNGVRLDRWTPDATGGVWTPKEETAPLAALNGDGNPSVSILSGFQCPIDGSSHHAGRGQVLAGSYDPNNGTYGGPTGPSLDQMIAEEWWLDEANRPLHKNLVLGISRRGMHDSTANGYSSIDASGHPVETEFSPLALFERLFVQADPTDPQAQAKLDMRTSILDVVKSDATALKQRLGKSDQLRLDAHFEAIHELGLTLGAAGLSCQKPTPPAEFAYQPSHEDLSGINRAMSRVLAMAFACDLTRVFSVQFLQMQADTIFWMDPINASEGSHVMTHDDRPIPDDQKLDPQPERTHGSVVFMMNELAFLLNELKQIPEGDGNVLDNSVILGTSEVSEGTSHSLNDMPVVLAGRAGGALVSGQHYRANGDKVTNVHLTCLRALGLDRPTFGGGAAETSQSVDALLV